MTETIITVQGEYSAWYPAERATVAASVRTDGPGRDDVFSRAVEASDALRNLIESIHDKDAGPVTWWSSDSVRVWSERPWNNEGKQLDPVFHAAVDFTAKFMEFEALARWVESAVGIDGVAVNSIEWALTDATRTSATVEVRSRAVKDAVAKASVYAQSIGLGSVTAIALADPGMLGDPSGGGSGPQPVFARGAMRSAAFDSSGTPQVALKPEEIAVASIVDARFVAK
ncbi:SIMPL domain-containing protein [Salinibacterium sp.]|uniref:SIMPL domain-containing protein n=1 Tax=Salinibacterium sp. TaxID=1915057 RepID=UPI00286D4FE6|nr:SIMPL domain-containing protein [Salinibacterium sp.]